MPRPIRPLASIATVAALLAFAPPASAQTLSQQKLDEIKRATVLIKVTNGEVDASGSGFLVRVQDKYIGYVVTNHHVIDLSHDNKTHRKPGEPREEYIEVVFDSGTKQESRAKGQVVAEDPERDLAILKVTTGNLMPKPIDLNYPPKLVETLPVLVCGFPFGEYMSTNARNPAITIGKATISSIRTNNAGDPVFIQLDGSVNPGNSGGPIVTADGQLVGVAVMTIRGAGIGLAIPHQEVSAMLAGRLGAPVLYVSPLDSEAVQLRLDVPLIDPFKNISRVKVFYKQANSGDRPPTVDKQGRWLRIPEGIPVEMTIRNGWAITSLRLPRDNRPSLWLQFEYTTYRGGTFLQGTTEYTMPQFRVTDGARDGQYLTTNRVSTDDTFGAKGGGVTLRDLHKKPELFVGTKVTLDVAIAGAVKRTGPQPELTIMFDKQTKAGNLRFLTSASLADQVEKTVGKDSPPASARVVGTVYAPDGKDQRCTVEIEEVRILTPEGEVSASLKSLAGEAAQLSPAKSDSPAAAKAESAASASDDSSSFATLVGVGGALLIAGIGVGLYLARRRPPAFAPESGITPFTLAHAPLSVHDTPPPLIPTPPEQRKEPSRRVRF